MTHTGQRAIAATAGFVAVLLAGPALAATQGAPGPVSRGSIAITVSLRAPPRVAGLSDFALDGASATTSASQDLCFTGIPHSYTIAASGDGPGGALSLSNGSDSVAYRVEWLPAGDLARTRALSGDVPATVRTVANRADCASAQGRGRLRIALDPAAAARLEAGAAYAGTLNLTLSPE